MPTWSVDSDNDHTADIGGWWALVWRNDEGRWCWSVQVEREGKEDSADAAREAAERAATALAWVPFGTGFRALGRDGTLYEVRPATGTFWHATVERRDGRFGRDYLADGHPTAEAAKAACEAHERSKP